MDGHTDLIDFEHVFTLFFLPGEVTEIRAFGLSGKSEAWSGYAKGIVSGYFDNAGDFARAAFTLDRARATGVYFVQNPVNPALLARARNRLKAAEATTGDGDIVCLRHLYLDADPERPKDISATDEEIEQAQRVLEAMRKHFEEAGWPEGLGAFSGNGSHSVHWLPDLPNDEEHCDLIKKALEAAHRMFSTNRVKIDPVNFNPARIGKLYGTVARKGDDTPDRPHRKSYIDPSCFNGWRPQALTIAQLTWLADHAPRVDRKHGQTDAKNGRLNVARYLEHYGRPFRVKEHDTGVGYTLDACPFEDEHTTRTTRGDAEIIQQTSGKLLFKCQHAHCTGRTWTDAKKKISGTGSLDPFWEGPKRTDGPKQEGSTGMTFTALEDLLAEADEDVPWVWDGILPTGGLSAITAKPKAGKSTFARNLAHCVAQGQDFLDRKVEQGPVLYCAFEEKRGEVKKHFRLMGTKGPIHSFINVAPDDAIKQLEGAVSKFKPVLVIIDTLFKLARIKDGNDYSQAITAIEPLLKLARDTGAHLATVHHAGKGERQGGDSILGSTGIFASVDTAIMIKRNDKYRTIQTIQRYGKDMEETTLKWDPERKMVDLGKSRQEEDLETMEEAILQFLQGQEDPLTEAAIDEAVEGKNALRGKALRNLVKNKQVERTGQGRKNDPFKYFCFVVPDVYTGTRKPESENDQTPNNGADDSGSGDLPKNDIFREQEKPSKDFIPEDDLPSIGGEIRKP